MPCCNPLLSRVVPPRAQPYVVELRERWDGTSKAKGDAALRHCASDELRHAFAKGDLVNVLQSNESGEAEAERQAEEEERKKQARPEG